MSVTLPVNFNPIDDVEFDLETPVSEELVRKMVQNINMLRALVLPASVIPVQTNLSGVTVPDAGVWQKCDGSEITTESPLNFGGAQNVPDMTGRYLSGPKSGYAFGNESGGTATVNLNHVHTLSDAPNRQDIQGANDTRNCIPADEPTHTHTVPDELSATQALELKHMLVNFYMKIV